jgi:hypothetical protein
MISALHYAPRFQSYYKLMHEGQPVQNEALVRNTMAFIQQGHDMGNDRTMDRFYGASRHKELRPIFITQGEGPLANQSRIVEIRLLTGDDARLKPEAERAFVMQQQPEQIELLDLIKIAVNAFKPINQAGAGSAFHHETGDQNTYRFVNHGQLERRF